MKNCEKTIARRCGAGTNDEWGGVDRIKVGVSLCLIVRCR